jgi:hypothetical protein
VLRVAVAARMPGRLDTGVHRRGHAAAVPALGNLPIAKHRPERRDHWTAEPRRSGRLTSILMYSRQRPASWRRRPECWPATGGAIRFSPLLRCRLAFCVGEEKLAFVAEAVARAAPPLTPALFVPPTVRCLLFAVIGRRTPSHERVAHRPFYRLICHPPSARGTPQ